MVKQIKIFTSNEPDIEDRVNKFLKELPFKKVVDIKYTDFYVGNDKRFQSICVVYEE